MNRTVSCCAVAAMLATFLTVHDLTAQGGVSSAAMGKSRAGVLPTLNNIRIEEYFNYHRHQLKLPKGKDRVSLDVRWSRLSKSDAVIQFGIATPRAIDPEAMPPLNLVLVIDRSGSMAGPRIENVRKAILAFVEGLRNNDLVTIVGFNHEASVHLPACNKTDITRIAKTVSGIEAGGYTNLHAGLMLGYRESLKNYDAERSNRVILLSDGLTNRGVTDPRKIAEQSKKFNKQGIDLSTIGLGHSFNEKLLRELADAGRGSIHFVGDAKDIKKTFVDELDSLLAPAARKVKLSIDFGKRTSDVSLYGYDPKQKDGRTRLKLDNLNCGATQIVMAKIEEFEDRPPIRVTLSYQDAVTGKSVEISKTVDLSEERAGQPVLSDPDIRKNYSITRVAYSIQQCLEQAEDKDFKKAAKKLQKGIEFARCHFDKGDDKDVDRIIKIAKDYQEKVDKTISMLARRHKDDD